MRYKLILVIFTALLYACGSSTPAVQKEQPSEQAHSHDHEHDHDHDHDTHEECDHDHDHSHDDHDHDHEGDAVDNHVDLEGAIVMCPTQAAELGVEYGKVELGSFAATVHTSGVIEAAPGDDAAIVATASGIVQFNGRKVVEGVEVGQGEMLFSVNSSGFVDDNLFTRIANAKAALAKASADLKRVEELYEIQMATASEMEEAKLAESTAQQELNRLTQNTRGGRKRIVSPLSGFITLLNVHDGDYVTQGEVLGSVSNNRTVVLRADLPARHFDKATEITSANFISPYNNKVYDVAELSGKKLATGRASASYTLPIRFEIENRSDLVAGSVVDVYLKTSPRKNVMIIPQSSLTEEQGAFYVYVRLDSEHYEKRNVQIGQKNGKEVEILKGLKSGETVVTKGAYFVRLASMSGEIPHDHKH